MGNKILVSIIGYGEKDEDFRGRLLGLITDEQVGIIMTVKEPGKKIITKSSERLSDFMDDYDMLEHKRLVATIIDRLEGVNKDDPTYKRIYISPRIGHVSGVTSSKEITLTCEEDTLIMLKEDQ